MIDTDFSTLGIIFCASSVTSFLIIQHIHNLKKMTAGHTLSGTELVYSINIFLLISLGSGLFH